MNAGQVALLVGLPGLLVGGLLGYAISNRKVIAGLFALGLVALAIGVANPPEGSREDDDDPVVFAVFAMVTNVAAYGLGLGLGAIARGRRVSDRRG